MNLARTLRSLALGATATSLLATGAIALPSSVASAAPPLPPDALVSPGGKVVLPQEAAAGVPERSRRGTSGFAGTAPSPRTGIATGPESIIGTDSRVRVTDTRSYPGRATVLILRNGGLHCTGWMVSKDTLVTAGHCVHSGGSSGSWYSGLSFRPGSDGFTAPYGTCLSSRTFAFSAWVNSRSRAFDGAIIKLNCSVGSTVGWWGMWWQSASLTGLSSFVRGYPGDKAGQQWLSFDRIRATETENIYYQNDTVGGMSGSPVYQVRGSGSAFCSGYCSMGIHTNGLFGSGLTASNNSGTRLTEGKFNAIVSIINLT